MHTAVHNMARKSLDSAQQLLWTRDSCMHVHNARISGRIPLTTCLTGCDASLQMLEITSLIGYFDLDPNRVAALVLDIFQDQWNNEAYLLLLPLFSQQAVTASLAFIYAHYQVSLTSFGTEPLGMADCCHRHTSLQALSYCWQTASKAVMKPI